MKRFARWLALMRFMATRNGLLNSIHEACVPHSNADDRQIIYNKIYNKIVFIVHQ